MLLSFAVLLALPGSCHGKSILFSFFFQKELFLFLIFDLVAAFYI